MQERKPSKTESFPDETKIKEESIDIEINNESIYIINLAINMDIDPVLFLILYSKLQKNLLFFLYMMAGKKIKFPTSKKLLEIKNMSNYRLMPKISRTKKFIENHLVEENVIRIKV